MFNIRLPSGAHCPEEKVKIHMDDLHGTKILATSLADYILLSGPRRQVIVLCIGTDRSTGDCLGPLVGTQLMEYTDLGFKIFGTLDQPVHANNLHQFLLQINTAYPSAFVIAIDACLGRLDSVGYVSLSRGALKPGAGVNKNLPMVGEAHFTGIVNVAGFMEYLVLQNTRLSVVMKMARQISSAVFNASLLVNGKL
ncbi:MAG TPA: spore protease YyaC [Verrucomicrobiae bacterium]|nr:spore protease YyaC [Verrucomicrobiae bacterium]